MKILYLSEILGPHDYRFLSTLVSRGYEVTLVAYRRSLEDDSQEARKYDVRNIPGLKIIHRPHLAENSYLNFLKRIIDFRRIIKEERPDVIHAGWIQTSGLLAAMSGFRPYLLMPWGSDIIHFSKNTLKNRIVTSYTIRSADMITCDCQYEKDIVVNDFKYPAERVLAMPWAVDLKIYNRKNAKPDFRKEKALEGKKILLMMRIFRPEYGIEDFLKALPAVKENNPNARVVMIGYGPLEGELKRLADKLGVGDIISWTGYQDREGIINYLSIADIYVSTSLRDGSSSSLLEAMAFGIPVVASDIPGNLEWIEDGVNGIIVKRNNPASVAEGLNRILKEDALRAKMSFNNAKKIEGRADFVKNFGKLENMYKEMCAKRKG